MTERLHSLLNVAVLFFVRPGYFLPYGHGVSPFGKVWDACAACDFASPARGKGGLLGAAPLLGPLCTPPGTPPKKCFQFPSSYEGNASYAAGASLTRSARSGDLPPRRVNARELFRFECKSASANYHCYYYWFRGRPCAFSVASGYLCITNLKKIKFQH